jgi:hypothetical protein
VAHERDASERLPVEGRVLLRDKGRNAEGQRMTSRQLAPQADQLVDVRFRPGRVRQASGAFLSLPRDTLESM